ncbi:hypothetical protein HN51_067637 [Arachis hypogaea]|uniref:Glycosyltransferase n=1 Tax=Arachis hypogaea TaxID=3818 RepID=A0A444ZQD2_ARAHY|nr:hypothetical protein Ahy_B04g073387 [Arachis hypogaea]
MADESKNLHIVMFPFLAFGHILPFYELAKLIAQKGHKISFISTPRNIKRLPKPPLNLQPFLELIELPLPQVENLPQNAESTMDIPHHMVPYLKKAFDGLEEPLSKFLESCTPHWIIYDFAPYWLPPISSKLGISCINLCIFTAFVQITTLNALLNPNSAEKEVAKGVYEFLTLQNESGVTDAFRIQESIRGAAAIFIRSCMEVEGESIRYLENLCKKPVIPIGLLPPPLPQNSNQDNNKDENWNTILKWLDEQEKESVIYVAFGSEVTLSDEEFIEINMGLHLSGCPFFWVLKNKKNIPNESNNNKLGIIWNGWAPQLKILAHKSIGGFLSHCGWSSIIESLEFGCPLILLPFQGEQELNSMVVEGMKVGVKVERNEGDGKFTRYSIAKALRTMMFQEEGKSCKRHAEEKKNKIFGSMEIQQKYIDDFVDYMQIHRPIKNN